ncbi:MAG: hypothetical protein NZ516_07465 [Raineya sp.]|nr:hypothetical protein [Raineya sp.]
MKKVMFVLIALFIFANASYASKTEMKATSKLKPVVNLSILQNKQEKIEITWCNTAFVTFSCGVTAIATFCNVTAEQFMFSLMLADMAFCQMGADNFAITFPSE